MEVQLDGDSIGNKVNFAKEHFKSGLWLSLAVIGSFALYSKMIKFNCREFAKNEDKKNTEKGCKDEKKNHFYKHVKIGLKFFTNF